MLDGLVTAIVRPLRAEYSSLELGPPRLRYGDHEYQRNDFIVINSRGLQIKGSYWSILSSNQCTHDACIVYLHPNSGSRIDVVKNARIMSIASHLQCNVCSFDFGGCGDSDGDCVSPRTRSRKSLTYLQISLGVREKEDVCAVMSYLLGRGCRRFILWGRSMGAATAVLFYGAYRELLVGTVIALILDSPFTSLEGLATQFTLTKSVPGLILAPALQYIRHSILSLHGFDVMQATPLASAKRINIPAIVLSGSEDNTVPPVLSEELYRALVGPKMRIFFVGSHNSKRPTAVFEGLKYYLTGAIKGMSLPELLDSCVEFLKNDIIPESGSIHGVLGEESKAFETISPGVEIILEEIKEVPIIKSPSHLKKKLHRMPSQPGDNSEKSSHQPWNAKWEMSRETHTYGINHQFHQGIRRNTTTSIHVNTQRIHAEHRHHHKKSSRPSIHSVIVDNGNGPPRQVPIPSEETPNSSNSSSWIGALGSLFWGTSSVPETTPSSPNPFSRPIEVDGSPAGSLGYLLHHLESDICPPDASSWETVLLARAIEDITDAVINQTISLATGLLDATLESTPHKWIIRDVEGTSRLLPTNITDNPHCLASQLFHQVMTELGFVDAADTSEANRWSSLLLLNPRELFEIIHEKDRENTEGEGDTVLSPEDQSGRTSGENLSSSSSNPDDPPSSSSVCINKPTN